MGFENAGSGVEHKINDRDAYFAELSQSEHILEIQKGENIDLNTFNVVSGSPDDFLIEEMLQSIVQYLNLPTIRDDFEDHQDRIDWYNASGLLKKYNADFYFENKLRQNKILGPSLWLSNLIAPRTQKRFNNISLFEAIEPKIIAIEKARESYGKESLENRLAFVRDFEGVLKDVPESLVAYGYVRREV